MTCGERGCVRDTDGRHALHSDGTDLWVVGDLDDLEPPDVDERSER